MDYSHTSYVVNLKACSSNIPPMAEGGGRMVIPATGSQSAVGKKPFVWLLLLQRRGSGESIGDTVLVALAMSS